jgi:vancomycin permeability regulator SanA
MEQARQSVWTRFCCFLRLFFLRVLRPVLIFVGCMVLALLIFAFSVSAAVCQKTEKYLATPQALEQSGEQYDCILVLGCAAYKDGRMSNMLEDRVNVGISLYRLGISNTVLMSGDNHNEHYNEVDPMRNAALDAGVPAECVEVDRYGLSTYESLYRAIKEKGYRKIVIVTQEYHLYRALYIAEKLGADAVGVSADLRSYQGQWRWSSREVLARCKDVLFGLVKPDVEYPME